MNKDRTDWGKIDHDFVPQGEILGFLNCGVVVRVHCKSITLPGCSGLQRFQLCDTFSNPTKLFLDPALGEMKKWI